MKSGYVKHKIVNLLPIHKIVTVNYFEFDKHFQFQKEKHDFWEMIYVDKGEVLVTLPQQQIRLKQGEGLFHKPNELHRHSADGISAPNLFIISFVCHSDAIRFFKNKKFHASDKVKELISSIIEEAFSAFILPENDPYRSEIKVKSSAPAGAWQMIRTYLEQMLIQILREDTQTESGKLFLSKKSMEDHIARAVLEILDKHLYSNITMDEISEQLNYSKTYLSKIFKNSCGFSIKHYYCMLKIAEAKRLIRERNHNFSEISDRLGFDNAHYFSRVFKRITDMTPSEYAHSVKID